MSAVRHPSPLRVGAGHPAPPGGWPLHGTQASRRIEAAAAAGLPLHTLMGRAGLAVARLALALAPSARRVWIAAGPGNNGGDGLEAAVHLRAAGKEVAVSLFAASARPADAAAALTRAQAAGVTLLDTPAPPWRLSGSELAIDALLGIGATRAPAGWLQEAIGALRSVDAGLLAVDLPSGLDADHGLCIDPPNTVRADWTLSLLTLKPGLFTAAGRDHAGAVWFDDLGVDARAEPPAARLIASLSRDDWPSRAHAQHKGSFGDLWVVGGAPGMTGAAVLAARAALAAGAGRVYLVSLGGPSAAPAELMQRAPEVLNERTQLLEQATVVCGCGGGEAVAEHLPAVIGRAGRLLLDADALNGLANDPGLAGLLRARHTRGRPTVLTPHPLEAARLLGATTAAVQNDRLGAARTLAAQLSAVVVLKGSGSIIAAPDGGGCFVNASGNAALATAGTGDVLSGWIGGLWSQGLEALDAARLGVYSHGLAADRWAASGALAAPLPAGRLIEGLVDLRRGGPA